MIDLQEMDTGEITHLYSMAIKELKRRKVIRTENIDAISRKGDSQKFEYVIVCKFDDNYELQTVLEMDWDTFLKNKRWHRRMHAWNLALTK